MYKFLGIIAFVCSLVITQTAAADGCGEGLKSMLSSIKMENGQDGKIKPILEHLKSNIKDSVNQMKALDDQIKQQVISDKMDQATVDGLVDKKAKLIGDMMKAKITAKNQILNALTPKQKAALLVLMQKLEDKMVAKYKSCHADD